MGFLRSHGLTVVRRRYRTPLGEIDIIAVGRGVVHMVEVKCRPDADTARAALSPRQLLRIGAAAEVFFANEMQTGPLAQCDIQMDAAFVVGDSVIWLEKAWSADEVEVG